MAGQRSITDQKAAFIRSQVRSLCAPIAPSSAWRDLGPSLEEGQASLSDKVVQDIVTKVNIKTKSHSRLVFSSQSQRHVAEQIDTLFWNEVTAEDFRATLDTTWLKHDVDLCEADSIALLPERYVDLYIDSTSISSPQDSEKYESLRRRLFELNQQREEQAQKLAMYRRLQQLLEPFENAQNNIQPNLVTKDGELSKELDRMRMLIARVLSRPGNLQRQGAEPDDHSVLTNDDKLARVLGMG